MYHKPDHYLKNVVPDEQDADFTKNSTYRAVRSNCYFILAHIITHTECRLCKSVTLWFAEWRESVEQLATLKIEDEDVICYRMMPDETRFEMSGSVRNKCGADADVKQIPVICISNNLAVSLTLSVPN
jgi:hypothetical protein